MADGSEKLPTREEIKCRAYEIYLAREDKGTRMETKTQALVDWLTAERELTELAPLSQPSTVEANPWLERNLWLRAERLASSQSDLRALRKKTETGSRTISAGGIRPWVLT